MVLAEEPSLVKAEDDASEKGDVEEPKLDEET